MKKTIILCLCIIMCFSLVACNKSGGVSAPDGFKLASNKDITNYYLFIPNKWKIENSTGTVYAYLPTNDTGDALATFVASFTKLEDTDVTLENYFETYKKEFSSVFGELVIDETKPIATDTLLDGKDAKSYIYTAKFGDVEYKYHQVICIKDDMVYTLTYASTAELFDKNATDMTGIIEHFKFN